MINPTTPGRYRVTQKAKGDSAGLPEGLSWFNYRHWTWTGNEWLDEQGTVVTNLTGCEGWEKMEG